MVSIKLVGIMQNCAESSLISATLIMILLFVLKIVKFQWNAIKWSINCYKYGLKHYIIKISWYAEDG